MYDYYKILNIPRNASVDEIKRAYRNKAKTVHPDVNNSPKASEFFTIVNEAYETLLDDKKRYLHDAKLNYADITKVNAEKKKNYYGSSVKNDTYTNTNKNSTFQYDWHSIKKAAYKFKDDNYYFKRSPVMYNALFVSGMFLGFLIAIVTIVGTLKDYWPVPFILIAVIGFILIQQGWKGIMGKQTFLDNIKKWLKKKK